MPNYFFITGLPRSRTAWLSALFNTQRDVICLHEPINQFGSWAAIKEYADKLPYKYVGISDSSLALHCDFIRDNFLGCPIIFIKRNESEAIKSISNFLSVSLQHGEEVIMRISKKVFELSYKLRQGVVVNYNDLNDSKIIEEIWDYCIPSIRIDKNKVELFQKLLINQHKEKVISAMELDSQNTLNLN